MIASTPTLGPPAPVTIRPVRPGDLAALDGLMTSLDDEARYRRWFTGGADVHRAAIWAADPERQHAVGLVAASADGELVGHAAVLPLDATRAEVCFEVAGDWRHHGIAGRLLDELELRASERGLVTLVAEVLPENADMLAVLREHGPCREHRDGTVIELQLDVALQRTGSVARAVAPAQARSRSAARAAASPGTPCTAPPGNVAALPRKRPFSGVR